jgi:hypothetical protein
MMKVVAAQVQTFGLKRLEQRNLQGPDDVACKLGYFRLCVLVLGRRGIRALEGVSSSNQTPADVVCVLLPSGCEYAGGEWSELAFLLLDKVT